MYKLLDAKAKEPYQVWLSYEDGTQGVVDLSDIAGRGVFEVLNDPELFATVGVGEYGELRWSEEIDLDPAMLYMRLRDLTPEELFPNLREARSTGA